MAKLAPIPVSFRTNPEGFQTYARDAQTLAREWVRPGTPGLEHRIGGLEKDQLTGAVSYDAENHDAMVRLRADKVAKIAQDIPATSIHGDAAGEVLVVGWGSTHGAITQAVNKLRAQGKKISSVHLRHLNPLPPDLEGVLRRFDKVVVPEMNLGQLVKVLRADVRSSTPRC